MSTGTVPVFRSTGRRGYSTEVSTYPGRVLGRKLAKNVQVQFAATACEIQTQEGLVHARTGDAIVTGSAGERWRVSRAHFPEKYRAVPPTTDGQDGGYLSLTNAIMAVPMPTAFEVILADGLSHLKGRPGDWLVDYGDGSLGIVAQSIFAATYEVIG